MGLSRRAFLQLAGLGGTALALGFHGDAGRAQAGPAGLHPDDWLAIGTDGRAHVTIGKSEMGQGVRTALAMLAAEELGVAMEAVDLVQAEPGPDFPGLGTGGSTSIQELWRPLRRSAAAARSMLVAAAAAQWGVAASQCRTESGAVLHVPSGRRLAFGPLVPAAARLPIPRDPPLKPAEAWTLLGHPVRRVDGPHLVDGSARYGLDQFVPGLKRAVVERCPVFGGRPRRWNEAKALARPGVRAVRAIGSGVALVADSTWQAMSAREALEVEWDEGPDAGFSSDGFRERLGALLAEPGHPARSEKK